MKPEYIESKSSEIMNERQIPTWNMLFPNNRGVSYYDGLVRGVTYEPELIRGVIYDA